MTILLENNSIENSENEIQKVTITFLQPKYIISQNK